MKTVLIAAVLLVAANAFAWTDGTYKCSGTQTVTITTVEVTNGVTVPHMRVSEKLTKASGFAKVVTTDGMGELVIMHTGHRGYAVNFKDGRVQTPCQVK